MEIKLIKGADIDKVKWNSCIHYAINGNIFGYKWFLDAVAREWDALVEGDYESVFPLPIKEKRWGASSLTQPRLLRELGLYSIHVLSPKRMQAFLEAVPSAYKSVDLRLNEQNPPVEESPFQITEHTNQQLLLKESYEAIANGYDRELLLELEKAVQAGLILGANLKPEKVAEFFRTQTAHYPGKESDVHALMRIMYNALHRGWGFASGVQNNKGDLLAANFFMYSHHKVISLAPAVSKEGKAKGALPYLFDGLIRSHAGRPMILDFNTTNEMLLPKQIGAIANAFLGLSRKKKWWSRNLAKSGGTAT
jgi:hypothetical protein